MEDPKDRSKIHPDLNIEKWSLWLPPRARVDVRARTLRREWRTPAGDLLTSTVKVSFTDEGVLTTEDQKTYYGCVKLWEQAGRTADRVRFSRRGLASILGKEWGGKTHAWIDQSLLRLRGTLFIWTNSWYDAKTGETVEVVDTFNILQELRLSRRKAEGHTTREDCYLRFNDLILGNLQNNYTKPVLFDTVIGFRSGIAQLLYVNLDLMLSDKARYERRSKLLFTDLGLEGDGYATPSDRKQRLEPALKELQGASLTTGVIASARLQKTKDKKDYKLVVQKSAAADDHTDDRASETTPAAHVEPDKAAVAQGGELVHYFLSVFEQTRSEPTPRELQLAAQFVARHGLQAGRFLVDFARREAAKTNYRVRTFGGILQYEAEARALDDAVRSRSIAPPGFDQEAWGAMTDEERWMVEHAEHHRVAVERVPGHRENLEATYGPVLPWEPGYVPLNARKGSPK